MNIFILTLFPEVFAPYLSASMIGRSQKKGLVTIRLVNIRDFGIGKHHIVDDRPYGGGPGMVLKADVLTHALKSVKSQLLANETIKVVLMSASGQQFDQSQATKYSKFANLIIIAGHYEGVDQRFIDKYIDEEISIGDYILTGGELPAMVVVDSIVRLIPGVLKKSDATTSESYCEVDGQKLLEHPQYTRPETFEGKTVPGVLISGNHQKIEKWKIEQSREKTKKIRPDLLKS